MGPTQKEAVPSLPAGTPEALRRFATPVISNGVIYTATDRPYAFPADCATHGGSCSPLWVGPASGAGQTLTAAAVTGDAVYFGSTKGRLEAFSVPRDTP